MQETILSIYLWELGLDMKITRRQLRQLILEERKRIDEVNLFDAVKLLMSDSITAEDVLGILSNIIPSEIAEKLKVGLAIYNKIESGSEPSDIIDMLSVTMPSDAIDKLDKTMKNFNNTTGDNFGISSSSIRDETKEAWNNMPQWIKPMLTKQLESDPNMSAEKMMRGVQDIMDMYNK